MNETEKMNTCERNVELVAYFYGEAPSAERESFDAHLHACAACRDELAAFAGVREAVGHWRAEILEQAPARSSADTFANDSRRVATASVARREAQGEVSREAQREAVGMVAGRHGAAGASADAATEGAASSAPPRRSARVALREFFTLSPPWLRAGVAAAALVMCALAALAVANAELRWDDGGLAFSTRLRRRVESRSEPNAAQAPVVEKVDTQAELDKLAAERDAALRELEDTRAQLDDSREANLIAAAARLEPVSDPQPLAPLTGNAQRRDARPAPATRAPSTPSARRKRTRGEADEEDVPRLYDLLREAN
ncbi:MAG TPA: zf-HC2 domain-containing protein [Pyrinomonadaceae bacterium]|jgi:hypothetical protein